MCLVYKLDFFIGMHVWKKHSIYRVQYCLWFQASTGGLERYALWIRGDYYK